MMFNVIPVWYMTAKVAMIEIGIEMQMIIVLRRWRRNRKRIIVASAPPMTAAERTLLTL